MSSACAPIVSGSVGMSGSFCVLTQTVTGPTAKMIKLVTTQTSLCPNTGANAQLLLNNASVASGEITNPQTTLQTEAQPGDQVTAVISTYPRNNGVVCVQLGELHVELQECDLVTSFQAGQTPPQTRDWYAWNNKMPPRPDDFHIVGEVLVSNPGVTVSLQRHEPQGINPQILILTLNCTQQDGIWPQVMTWKEARYDKVLVNSSYDSVQIMFEGSVIQTVPVDTVQ